MKNINFEVLVRIFLIIVFLVGPICAILIDGITGFADYITFIICIRLMIWVSNLGSGKKS